MISEQCGDGRLALSDGMEIDVHKGRKYDQVLEGARRVFMRDGYEGASVDDIAREASVSKATLYSYFSDKRLMFKEVFRHELLRERTDASALVNVDLPIEQMLPFVAQLITNHMVSEFGLRTYRISVAEAERFPALSAEFYQSGPRDLQKHLSKYIEKGQERGELMQDIPDLELAADSFVHLIATRVFDHALFLGRDSVTPEMIRESCDNGVRVFLRAYGTPETIERMEEKRRQRRMELST